MFKLARTFSKPGQGAGAQRGFPAPGDGAQTVGPYTLPPGETAWEPMRPTKGKRTFFGAARPKGEQRGFPSPNSPAQRRPAGAMPNVPDFSGLPTFGVVAMQSYGTARWAPQYGKVLTNPIGAGVVALNRPQASYGAPAQYENGAIWWTTQQVPTSIHSQSLNDPTDLLAVLGSLNVQAVVRTTG